MEKVTVKIGKISSNSAAAHTHKRTAAEDIEFLMDSFEISHKRAQRLNSSLEQNHADSSMAFYIDLDLDYRQLARYTAKRQVEGLNRYWKYPHVLKHLEHEEPAKVYEPIELRPNVRTIP